jgi:hypothetical protein
MNNDFYSLFSAYWWLLFPLGWAIFRLVRLSLDHKRAGQALELIKTYADQGKEIPPDLLKVLQQPNQTITRSPREKARALLVPGFVFISLAASCLVLVIGRVAGNERDAYVGMMSSVVLFLGMGAAFFIIAYLYHRDSKKLDSP